MHFNKMMIDQLLSKFSNSTVLVIGDVMVDAYLKGSVGRISPEAPVPIVDVEERFYRLGGAANVAINLQSLGATPLMCSVIGDDDKADVFDELMQSHHLDNQFILRSPKRKTTIKYRILANSRQVLRVDEEDTSLLEADVRDNFLKLIEQTIENQKIDAIIFEDYDKGVICRELVSEVVKMAKARNIIVTVDPKKRNFNYYQGVTMFKPNLKELKEGLEDDSKDFSIAKIEERMRKFAQINEMDYLFTTMSEKGVALYDRGCDLFYTYPAFLRQISDVSGAGDTVISVATLCLLAGLPVEKSAQVANLAGGIVCEYSGVTPIPLARLREEIVKNNLIQ